jgi:SRSO17 transposase
LICKTEPALGLERLSELARQGVVPFRWVNADEHYGMKADFLDGVAALGKWYFAEVQSRRWSGRRAFVFCRRALAKSATASRNEGTVGRAWREVSRRRKRFGKSARSCRRRLGSATRSRKAPKARSARTSPLFARGAFVAADPATKAPVIFRRSASDPTEIKYYLSNAPARVAKTGLVRQAGLRWSVETALEEDKSEWGWIITRLAPGVVGIIIWR